MTAYTLTCDQTTGYISGETSLANTIKALFPIVYWPLNETSGTTAYNYGSTASTDGTYTGATLAQVAAPGGGLAPLFDGVNDYAGMGSAALTALNAVVNLTSFSVAVWFKVSDIGDWSDGYTRSAYTVYTNTTNTFRILKSSNTNMLTLEFYGGGTYDLGTTTSYANSDWHLAVMTVSVASDLIVYYADGGSYTSDTGIGTWSGAVAVYKVGSGNSANYWKGYLAHSALFNSILTADQVSAIYTAGSTAGTDWTRLLAAQILTCADGTFILTGQTLAAVVSPRLQANLGTFIYLGDALTMRLDRIYVVEYGAFTLTPQDASIYSGVYITLYDGVFIYVGVIATLTYSNAAGYRLVLDVASMIYIGVILNFTYAPLETMVGTLTFGELLDRCQAALGDPSGAIWDRSTTIWSWACDALRAFPVWRPMQVTQSVAVSGHIVYMPADFIQVIYVEYPVGQEPPEHLLYKNHLDPEFFSEDGWYDMDRYTGGAYTVWISNDLAAGEQVTVRYLAQHTAQFTSEDTLITVENQYVQVVISHVVLMAFTERLARYLSDPTAQTAVLQQLTNAVQAAEEMYRSALRDAIASVAQTRLITQRKVDKYDRIY